jgi:hypothetical protein
VESFFVISPDYRHEDSLLKLRPTPLAAPGSAAAVSRGAAGTIVTPPGSGTRRLIGSRYHSRNTDNHTLGPGVGMLYDRLSHQSGLDGTVTTPQTTNLPTAALTRYTSGDGVVIMVSIYLGVGATPTTITASYTNQAGTSGRTTEAGVLGGPSFAGPGATILGLQAGDTGVRSVESVTLAGSTGSAGNFGVTLMKPLILLTPVDGTSMPPRRITEDFMLARGVAPVLQADAALYMLTRSNANSSGACFSLDTVYE